MIQNFVFSNGGERKGENENENWRDEERERGEREERECNFILTT